MRGKLAFLARHRRIISGALICVAAASAAPSLRAQSAVSDSAPPIVRKSVTDSVRTARRRYWQRMTAGFLASIAAHEGGHIAASFAMGFHPHFGTDNGRPTIFSGIDDGRFPHKQFIFSAAGLTAQELLDELILDIPHKRGAAFEKGILAGGIGTTLFYVTVGRNARVSDISLMARSSSLSKSQVSLIFGSVSLLHAVRIGRDHHYAHFFAVPSNGGLKTGVSIRPE
jgi:hypothetical protein